MWRQENEMRSPILIIANMLINTGNLISLILFKRHRNPLFVISCITYCWCHNTGVTWLFRYPILYALSGSGRSHFVRNKKLFLASLMYPITTVVVEQFYEMT